MWTPWAQWATWQRRTQQGAVENARQAAVECSRALAERMEVELYLADQAEQRRLAVQRRERPSGIA